MNNIYNDLKSKQQDFIRKVAETAVAEGKHPHPDSTFSRNWLRNVAKSMGIAWAPAWIVKDVSRQRGRGEYLIPEVHAWKETQNNTNDDTIADRILGDEITEVENAMDMMDPAVAGEKIEMNGV